MAYYSIAKTFYICLVSPEQKIKALTKELKEHNYKYYVLAQPSISDREFDEKLKELEALEEAYPGFADPNSPTRKIGGDITKEFRTVEHSVPMLSLSNTYNEDELSDFNSRVEKLLEGADFQYVTELKIDGFAIALLYEQGKLSAWTKSVKIPVNKFMLIREIQRPEQLNCRIVQKWLNVH